MSKQLVTDPEIVPYLPSQGEVNATTGRASSSARMVQMALALLSAQVSTWLVALIGLVVMARYLGTHDFGVLTTAGTVAGFTVTLASLGTTNYVIKGVARSPATSPGIFVSVVTLRLVAWLAACTLLIPAVLWMVGDGLLRWSLIVLLLASAFDLLRTAGNAALQAHYALGRVAVGQGLLALLMQCGIVALLMTGRRLDAIIIVMAVSSTITGIGTAAYFWRRFGTVARVTRDGLLQVARGSAPYLAWDAALLIFGSIDILMLATLSGPAAAGYYGLALRLSTVSAFVYVILSGAVFPSLAAMGAGDVAGVRALLARAAHLLLVATLPIAVGIMLLAREITTLIAGDAFLPAAPVVLLMAGVIPLVGLDTLLGTALFAIDRQREWIIVAWCAAVLNVVMNLIAIPLADQAWGNPAIGAGVATILTELLMGATAWILLGPYRDGRAARSTVIRALIACAAMAGPVLLVRGIGGLAVAVPVGILTYAAAAIALRLVSLEDVRFVRRSLTTRSAE